MPSVIIPEMPPVPEGATSAERRKMFDEYMADLIEFNPAYLNDDGSSRSVGSFFFETVTPNRRGNS